MQTSEPKRVPRRRRLWWRLLLYPLVGYVAWCATLYFYQDHLLFPIDATNPPAKPRPDPRATVMHLNLADGGQVESWFMPAPTVSRDNPGPAVIFFHGNAELIDDQHAVTFGYHRLGCSVLLPEYRGYGRSAGSPSERGILEDAIQFYEQLAARPDVDRTRIVFHGRSLGGGLAAQLSLKRKPIALILESTFASVAQMASDYAAPSFLVKHPFRTDRALPQLSCPILLFHGTCDSIIPVEHGRTLHKLVPKAAYVEYNCDHNDFPGPRNDSDYWNQIQNFLSQAHAIK